MWTPGQKAVGVSKHCGSIRIIDALRYHNGRWRLQLNNESGRLIAAGDLEGALAVLDAAISQLPLVAAPYKTRAEVLRSLGQWRRADEDLRQYVSMISSGRGGVLGRLSCSMGFHEALYQYDRPGVCTQTGFCERCLARCRRQPQHLPAGEWRYTEPKYVGPSCEQFMRCSRCAKPAAFRVWHDWTQPNFPHRCRKCGLEDEGPSGVYY